MKQTFALFMVLALCISCAKNNQPIAEDIEEIKKILSNQEDAWNAGDHPGFMLAYWNNDNLRFVGSSGVSYGYQTLLNMYQNSFPTSERMGQLQFSLDSFYTERYPMISVDGHWQLNRKDTVGGHFVLVFEKKDGEWKITEDHTW